MTMPLRIAQRKNWMKRSSHLGTTLNRLNQVHLDGTLKGVRQVETTTQITRNPDSARDKLYNVIQGRIESVMSYTHRFRQQLNEYRYAIQNEHTRPTTRQIALSISDKEAIKTYVRNLRYEIGVLIYPNRPNNVSEAQSYALEAEMALRESMSNYSVNASHKTAAANNPSLQQSGSKEPRVTNAKLLSGRLRFRRTSFKNRSTGRFLLDTGVGLNLIKERYIKGSEIVNEERIFLMVPDDFPLLEDGMIGLPFLEQ
ncbi:hypothetical protein WN55_07869 [Dufourea novaeangliae]|uniref:Uncharacterized protein n=1 Tax=Dufourea novaeangliae TaxID=178035 RepID=A0A154PUM1_DUFNO|nr:hypothetical protein WN55_07869 [Dufourea novaeangliae]